MIGLIYQAAEAYRQRLSLLCYCLSTPCNECKHNTRHFFDNIFIKAWFCWGEIILEMCLFCHMTSVGWLEIMIHHTQCIICDFHFPVDFRINTLSSFGPCIRMGIGWFTPTKLRSVVDEEKTIPSCLDTSSPMIAPPVLLLTTFCALKKTD